MRAIFLDRNGIVVLLPTLQPARAARVHVRRINLRRRQRFYFSDA